MRSMQKTSQYISNNPEREKYGTLKLIMHKNFFFLKEKKWLVVCISYLYSAGNFFRGPLI